tara:strand:+ start:3844 stop:4914 length:1071 start_codon:yes stop_codon:yes gene_type:complete
MNKNIGLYLRRRFPLFINNDNEVFEKFKYYKPQEIAVLCIGMWNSHSCNTALERQHQIAKKANVFLKKMRNAGSQIIIGGSYPNYACKSGNWQDTNLRKNIRQKPIAKLIDRGLSYPVLPFDDSDGGYKKEDKNFDYEKKNVTLHPDIDLDYEKDCISNYSKEILNFLHFKNIKCLVVFGAHTNMCVLDKPYGIKWYVRYGFPVIVVRDLCDTMYNPEMPPYISQPESNKLMSEWLETHICPSINSNEILFLNKKTYFVDIDKTITTSENYEKSQPKKSVINKINNLYEQGHNIIYWTSRGIISDKDWLEFTQKQLSEWGAKYTILRTKKPFFDMFIDDKSINLDSLHGMEELMAL